MSTHRQGRTSGFSPLSILLTTGATLGVACLLAAAACLVLGLRPMVVTSGSMSPTIPAGSLAFARSAPADEVQVGDIVAVRRADGLRVMHRVVSAEPSGDHVALTLQGDANSTPDPEAYVVDRVLAEKFHVPWLGYPVSWMATPGGLLGLGAAGCGLLLFSFRRTSTPRTGGRRAAVAAPLAVVAIAVTASPSSAAFTDTGTVTSGAAATYTVPATTLTCGGLGVLSVTFNWTAVPNATDYTLHFGSGGSSTVTTTSTTRTITTALSGGTAWVVVNRTVGSTTWSSVASNTRSYTVAVVSLCS